MAASVGMGRGPGLWSAWAAVEAGHVHLRRPVSDPLRSPSCLHTRVAPGLPLRVPLCVRHRGPRRRPCAGTPSPVAFEPEWVWVTRVLAGREPARRGPQLTSTGTSCPAADTEAPFPSLQSALTWPQ